MIPIEQLTDFDAAKVLSRERKTPDVSQSVAKILADVQAGGIEKVLSYCAKFDGAAPEPIEATPKEMDEALAGLDPELTMALCLARDNIEDFHRRQAREGFAVTKENGVVLGQRILPIHRVGLYVPGGKAAYPSTVLMDAIPAKVAGVREIVMVTPARNGKINPLLLAAARIAGVDRVFKVGGAQAIAALAYGAGLIPKVDKIVGPGNAYVAEAKRQVFGQVGIDMVAGPSEILILADSGADPDALAADLLSQAEHDEDASAVLISDSSDLLNGVQAAISRRLSALPRKDIAGAALRDNGRLLLVPDMDFAVKLSNELAPEHLELCVKDPFALLGKVENAGSVFLGYCAPEALGDYLAGPNHTLPTSGTARFSSPLSVDDFVKKSAFTYYTKEALSDVCGSIARIARAEGLEAHALSALSREGKP